VATVLLLGRAVAWPRTSAKGATHSMRPVGPTHSEQGPPPLRWTITLGLELGSLLDLDVRAQRLSRFTQILRHPVYQIRCKIESAQWSKIVLLGWVTGVAIDRADTGGTTLGEGLPWSSINFTTRATRAIT